MTTFDLGDVAVEIDAQDGADVTVELILSTEYVGVGGTREIFSRFSTDDLSLKLSYRGVDLVATSSPPSNGLLPAVTGGGGVTGYADYLFARPVGIPPGSQVSFEVTFEGQTHVGVIDL